MSYLDTREATTYTIRIAADLDQLASGGVITITSSTQLIFENLSAIVTTNRFNVTSGTLAIDSNGGPREITFVSASDLFTVSGSADFDINEINITNDGTGTLFNSTTTGQLEVDNCNFTNFLNLGSITNAFVVVFRNFQFIIWNSGLSIDAENVGILSGGTANLSTPSTAFILYGSKATTPFANIWSALTVGLADFIQIDPGLSDQAKVIISNGRFDQELFDVSGSTGGFTAVADAAIGSTSITSVTDSSGVARFNFTGPTVYVNEEVVISGYVTNTAYNQTAIITATDGTSYFEARVNYTDIAFGSDEGTGSFTSARVTVTATAHGLSEGTTLTLDCTENTDYDGGATIYNALTNSFQINRTFTATRAGTWSTEGLNASDPRVIAVGNPGVTNSKVLGGAFANNLTTATTGITNGVFQDIVFGTGGSQLVSSNLIERFKLINAGNGTLEYTGNEPFIGTIQYDFIVLSTGGNQNFHFKWVVDRAPRNGTFVDLTDAVIALADVGSTADSFSKTQAVTLNKGDQVKPQLTRDAGTSSITLRYITINIQ